jgi:hypothetical protein
MDFELHTPFSYNINIEHSDFEKGMITSKHGLN